MSVNYQLRIAASSRYPNVPGWTSHVIDVLRKNTRLAIATTTPFQEDFSSPTALTWPPLEHGLRQASHTMGAWVNSKQVAVFGMTSDSTMLAWRYDLDEAYTNEGAQGLSDLLSKNRTFSTSALLEQRRLANDFSWAPFPSGFPFDELGPAEVDKLKLLCRRRIPSPGEILAADAVALDVMLRKKSFTKASYLYEKLGKRLTAEHYATLTGCAEALTKSGLMAKIKTVKSAVSKFIDKQTSA